MMPHHNASHRDKYPDERPLTLHEQCEALSKLAKEGRLYVLDPHPRPFLPSTTQEVLDPFDHICHMNGEVWIECFPAYAIRPTCTKKSRFRKWEVCHCNPERPDRLAHLPGCPCFRPTSPPSSYSVGQGMTASMYQDGERPLDPGGPA